jgi:hypothetical protein
MSRLSVGEIHDDQKSFGIEESQGSVVVTSPKVRGRHNLNNLDNVLTMLRDLLGQRGNRKGRIFTDILSSVLILNSQEGSYRFVSQLIEELKLQDAVLLATLEEGMRPSQIQVAMQQLFDGFIELSLFKE